MKINLATIYAGPAGTLQPGEHTVSDEIGKSLVDAGCAVEIKPAVELTARHAAVETATNESPEKAVTRKPGRPRKAKTDG